MALARNKCRELINLENDDIYQYVLLIDTDLHINLYMTHIQKALEVRKNMMCNLQMEYIWINITGIHLLLELKIEIYHSMNI